VRARARACAGGRGRARAGAGGRALARSLKQKICYKYFEARDFVQVSTVTLCGECLTPIFQYPVEEGCGFIILYDDTFQASSNIPHCSISFVIKQ